MGRYIARRLVQAVFVLLGVSLAVFMLVRLSGDPAAIMLPLDATQDQYQALRRELGLDDPIAVQFGRFLARAVRGDFGESLRSQQPALGLVMERLPATITLAGSSLLFSLIIAFPIGIYAALHPRSLRDRLSMLFALFGQSAPVFWLGIMLILLFAVQLRWLPTGGYGEVKHLILPTVALGLYSAARTARLVRSGMLETLAEDYIRTARAKGLSPARVVIQHALRNALIPVVTVIGLDAATLLSGAVITETVFGWPGVGRLVVQAIGQRDYPVVQATVALVALIYVGLNLAIDVAYAYLDPRIRLS